MTSRKSTKNIVSTTEGQKYRIGKQFVKGPYAGSYFAPKAFFLFLFDQLFRYGRASIEVVVYTRESYTTFNAKKSLDGGLQIGCNVFSVKETKKLFRLCGAHTTYLKRYFPVALAAAAGN